MANIFEYLSMLWLISYHRIVWYFLSVIFTFCGFFLYFVSFRFVSVYLALTFQFIWSNSCRSGNSYYSTYSKSKCFIYVSLAFPVAAGILYTVRLFIRTLCQYTGILRSHSTVHHVTVYALKNPFERRKKKLDSYFYGKKCNEEVNSKQTEKKRETKSIQIYLLPLTVCTTLYTTCI